MKKKHLYGIMATCIIILLASLSLIYFEGEEKLWVDAGGDKEGYVGETIYFKGEVKGSASKIVRYQWDFDGDGKIDWSSSKLEVTHWNYKREGVYKAEFIAIDENGNTGRDSCLVRIKRGLLLNVSLSKRAYCVGECIIVNITLTNVGDRDIKISQVGLAFSTLDLMITTPEGYTLHYTGPTVETLPRGIELDKNESYVYSVNLTDSRLSFGNENVERYLFTTPGRYEIKVIYKSDPAHCFDHCVWDGILESSVLGFTIE